MLLRALQKHFRCLRNRSALVRELLSDISLEFSCKAEQITSAQRE